MQHHRWEILTSGGEVLKGMDSMPKQGVRDAARALKFQAAGHPTEFQVLLPNGADLIFKRSVELLRVFGGPGGPLKKSVDLVTYTVGYEFNAQKSCLVIGQMERQRTWWEKHVLRKPPTAHVPYATLIDSDSEPREDDG